MSAEDSDVDDRTLYVAGISEKVTDKIFYELFFQAGPLERVSIPKEKDGKNKTFGFVTYKHLTAVQYALNIFSGTKLFGRELTLRNRNANNSNRNSLSNQQQSSPLASRSFSGNPLLSAINSSDDMLPAQYNMLPLGQQPFASMNPQLMQQMVVMQAMQMYGGNAPDMFPSTRSDNNGSQRDFVDRNRYHRDEERNNRSKPYRRSRSRSPQRNFQDRSRSPVSSRAPYRDKERDNRRRDNRNDGYGRWNHRK